MIIVHLGTLSALHACGLLTNVGAITINGRGNLLENLKGKMFVGHRRYWFRCVRKKKREAFLREYKSGSAMRSDWYFSLDRFINFDWVFRSLTYIATCFITVETRALFINIWNISKKFIFLFLRLSQFYLMRSCWCGSRWLKWLHFVLNTAARIHLQLVGDKFSTQCC